MGGGLGGGLGSFGLDECEGATGAEEGGGEGTSVVQEYADDFLESSVCRGGRGSGVVF
jgi:hypothetical protein